MLKRSFFPAGRACAVMAMAAVCASLSLCHAKPKSSEYVGNENVLLDGKYFSVTTDNSLKDCNRGLVTTADANSYPSNLDRGKWVRVLDPVYNQITVVKDRLFVKRVNGFEAPFSEIVLKKKGSKYSVEKEVPTPYNQIRAAGDKVLIGQKFTGRQWVPPADQYSYGYEAILYTSDVIAENGTVANTLHNVEGDITVWANNILVVPFLDGSSNKVYGLTDLQGNLIAPLMPDLTFMATYTDSGGKSKQLMALPLDKERKYWMPLRNDGTVPVEPLPIKGYMTPYPIRGNGKLLDYWLKEYETENGPAIGWASPDLTEETGPKWKSFTSLRRGFPLKEKYTGALMDHTLWVGQLLDGTWMGYDTAFVDGSGYKMVVFKPLLETSFPTQDAMLQAVTPIFTERGDRIMAKAQQQAVVYAAWKEQMKKYQGCDAGEDLYSAACVERGKTLTEYNEAVQMGWHERAYNAARKLGGDHFLNFLLDASRRKIYTIEPETFFNFASSTKDPALAARAKQRYEELLAERKRAAEAARQAALQPKVTAAAPASGGYQSSWSSSSWATSNSYKPAGPSHQQTLDNYLRDYKTWMNGMSSYKPSSPY